jgi:Flp pilus assembly protein TadD
MEDRSARRSMSRVWGLQAATLAGAVFLAYAASFGHDFVDLDDHFYVVENERVRAGLSPDGVWWAFSGLRCQNYQPLTLLSHMADCSLFGLDARGHHATSVVLHALNTVLFFLLLQRATAAAAASFAAAFLFGLHPLRVEAVAWVAARKDLLCGLFFLLALLAYTAYARRRDGERGGRAWPWYLAALGCHGAALLSKPIAVTLPCVLLLFDVWPLGRDRGPEPRVTRWPVLAREKIPFFILSAAHAALTLVAQRSALASLDSLPVSGRVARAVVFLGWQTWASLCPLGLAVSYPFPRDGFPTRIVIASAAGLVAVTAICLALRRRTPALTVGWLWFVGMLFPVLGLLQAGDQGVADRWTYLPGMGFAAAIAYTAADGLATLRTRCGADVARTTGAVALACAAFVLVTLTARQTSHWRDAEALWRRSATLYPGSDKALTNLGWALHEKGHDDEAMRWFAAGLAVNPRHADCANTLGLLLAARGRSTEAEECFRLAIDSRPDLAAPHANLGMTLARLGKFTDAEKHFETALGLDPANPDFHYNYGVMLRDRGALPAARERFTAALRLDPAHRPAARELQKLESAGR